MGEWDALEQFALDEFQAKAPLHFERTSPHDDKFSWLALMQHHGVPTRLPDFTDSPYVAHFFALRACTEEEKATPAAVWAIDAEAIRRRCEEIITKVRKAVESSAGQAAGARPRKGVSLHPDDAASVHNEIILGTQFSRDTLNLALSSERKYQWRSANHGLVAFALPPIQNRRLSSQQGAFLFNGAEDLSFEESLSRMMAESQNWCRKFSIEMTERRRGEFERKLFQMNIHPLSLFPDAEGLTGFVRQAIRRRFHWS